MKNTFLIIAAGLLFSFAAEAQKTKKKSTNQIAVPEMVKTTFTNDYSIAEKNKWSKNYSGNYIAKFTNADTLTQEVEYLPSGVMVKSKTILSVNNVPQILDSSIRVKYADANLQEITKIQIPGVAPYYKAIVMVGDIKRELYISEEGYVTR